MNNKKEILRVEGLKQYFKLGSGKQKSVNKAVDDISFNIFEGEVFSLVGESGCGKTTTGRTLIKLYEATGGEVYFHGTRIISDVKARKATHKALLQQLADRKNSGISPEKEAKLIEQIKESKEQLKLAKRDKKFEKIVDEEGLRAKDDIESFKEYQELVTTYDALDKEHDESTKAYKNKITELTKKIKATEDKVKLSELNAELKEFEKKLKKELKELKLNNLRFKQDVKTLKHDLIYKNKLLMRSMQMIFQDPIASLNPRMTVKEIVAEGLRINGVKNEKLIDERVKNALKLVNLLPEHASRYPHEFSGGQRQRIGIARALIVNPSFIIADEPISNLDVSIRAQIINLLNDLRHTKGITILFIAHDLSVVKYFTDRLAVMYFGHIVEMGDKDKIFNNPLHPYTLSLMNSIPLPDPLFESKRGKTVRYNPQKEHDYSVEKPTLREVEPGHFVLCNTEEFDRYQKGLK